MENLQILNRFGCNYEKEKVKVSQDLVSNLVEVRLKNSEDFLKIAETLTRIGVTARGEPRLFQTCHILHKRGKFYIVHFKEMLALDGNSTNYNDDDRSRRNKIVQLLEQWKLLEVIDKDKVTSPVADISKIKVISHADKPNWTLVQKYTIGKKR